MLRIFICAILCNLFLAVSISTAEFQSLYVENGTLYYEDGNEVVFWGVNLQPSLSWEYNRMKRHGLHDPFDKDDYKDHVCRCESKNCIGYIISSDEWYKYKSYKRKLEKK